MVVGRQAEMRVIDPNSLRMTLISENIPYGAKLFYASGDTAMGQEDIIFETDPFNAVIIAEGQVSSLMRISKEGVTYRVESDAGSVLLWARRSYCYGEQDRSLSPAMNILSKSGELLKSYNLPTGSSPC